VVEVLKKESLLALCTACIDRGTEVNRLTACEDFYEKADSDPDFLKKIVIVDESWCFAYDLAKKRQSPAWDGENSPRPRKLRLLKSRGKNHVGYILQFAGSLAQRICTGRPDC
jgi:hypothetical protein